MALGLRSPSQRQACRQKTNGQGVRALPVLPESKDALWQGLQAFLRDITSQRTHVLSSSVFLQKMIVNAGSGHAEAFLAALLSWRLLRPAPGIPGQSG